MIADLTIAGTRLCHRCPRIGSMLSGLDRLAELQLLTPEDVEDMAMLACGRCVAEVECEHDESRGWVLSLAPAARVRL